MSEVKSQFQRQQKTMDIRISIAWSVIDDKILTIPKELVVGAVLQQGKDFHLRVNEHLKFCDGYTCVRSDHTCIIPEKSNITFG